MATTHLNSNDKVLYGTISSDSLLEGQRHRRQSSLDFATPIIRTLSEGVETLTHAHFVLSEEALAEDNDRLHRMDGTATIPSEVANMTKNLIGGGVLSLSGGIAIFANNAAAVWPAIFWVVLLGAVFGYFCLL